MEDKKRKSLRERFEEDYTAIQIPADNAKGYRMEYIYYAPWHIWDLPEDRLFHRKWMLMYLSIAGFFLNLLSMLQPSGLNHMAVGMVLGALILCCHVMEFKGLIQLLFAGYRTTRMTFRDVDRVMTFIPLLRCLCGLAFALVSICYVIRGGGRREIILVLGYGLAGMTGGLLYYLYEKIPSRIEENNTLDQYEEEEQEEKV